MDRFERSLRGFVNDCSPEEKGRLTVWTKFWRWMRSGGGFWARTNPAGKGDPFPEPNGIGFFVVNMKGGAGLFGEQQLEGVGAEVENGAAKREICHTKV